MAVSAAGSPSRLVKINPEAVPSGEQLAQHTQDMSDKYGEFVRLT